MTYGERITILSLDLITCLGHCSISSSWRSVVAGCLIFCWKIPTLEIRGPLKAVCFSSLFDVSLALWSDLQTQLSTGWQGVLGISARRCIKSAQEVFQKRRAVFISYLNDDVKRLEANHGFFVGEVTEVVWELSLPGRTGISVALMRYWPASCCYEERRPTWNTGEN